MASSSKKKTTMAKLTRESKLRERRLDKQARKEARKLAPADHSQEPGGTLDDAGAEPVAAGAGEAPAEPLADA
jgi:hypothetical protein